MTPPGLTLGLLLFIILLWVGLGAVAFGNRLRFGVPFTFTLILVLLALALKPPPVIIAFLLIFFSVLWTALALFALKGGLKVWAIRIAVLSTVSLGVLLLFEIASESFALLF